MAFRFVLFRFALFIIARLFESEPHLLRGFQGWLQKTCQPIPLKKKAGDGTPKAGYVSNLRVRGSMEKTFISPETLMMDLWLDAYEPQSSREESWMAKWKGWLVGWLVGGFSHWVGCFVEKMQYCFFFRKKIGIVELKFLFFVSL